MVATTSGGWVSKGLSPIYMTALAAEPSLMTMLSESFDKSVIEIGESGRCEAWMGDAPASSRKGLPMWDGGWGPSDDTGPLVDRPGWAHGTPWDTGVGIRISAPGWGSEFVWGGGEGWVVGAIKAFSTPLFTKTLAGNLSLAPHIYLKRWTISSATDDAVFVLIQSSM